MIEFLKKWIVAIRLWTLTASIIPVCLGAMLAWYEGYAYNMPLFWLTLIAGILLQTASNLLNTYGDYSSGVDSSNMVKKTNTELFDGTITAKQIKNVALLCIFIAAILGLILIYHKGFVVFLFGLLGILGTVCYTTGKYPFKYYGLGTIFVFFLMGSFMVIPAYYIQSSVFNFQVCLFSLPISFLVAVILFGNEIRDLKSDKEAGIRTLAMAYGQERALELYTNMIYMAYICLVILAVTEIIPTSALLPLLLIPMLTKQIIQLKAPVEREVLDGLVKFSAKFHFLFGALMIIGILLRT